MALLLFALTPAGWEPRAHNAETLDSLSQQLPAGVFTTLRTYQGNRIVGLSAHLLRLGESLAALGRRAGTPAELPGFRRGLREVIRTAGQPGRDLRLRLTAPFTGPELYIACEPFEPFPASFYEQGVRCATTALDRQIPEAKTTAFIAPSREAKAHTAPGIHELLRVDPAGVLLEGVTSNFFAVLDGALRTAAAGVLAGVTRQTVLAQAAGRLPIVLEPVRVAEVPRLSEAFITSASREVMPVVAIDDVTVGDGRPGPASLDLLSRYRGHLLETSEAP